MKKTFILKVVYNNNNHNRIYLIIKTVIDVYLKLRYNKITGELYDNAIIELYEGKSIIIINK